MAASDSVKRLKLSDCPLYRPSHISSVVRRKSRRVVYNVLKIIVAQPLGKATLVRATSPLPGIDTSVLDAPGRTDRDENQMAGGLVGPPILAARRRSRQRSLDYGRAARIGGPTIGQKMSWFSDALR